MLTPITLLSERTSVNCGNKLQSEGTSCVNRWNILKSKGTSCVPVNQGNKLQSEETIVNKEQIAIRENKLCKSREGITHV